MGVASIRTCRISEVQTEDKLEVIANAEVTLIAAPRRGEGPGRLIRFLLDSSALWRVLRHAEKVKKGKKRRKKIEI